MGGTRTAQRKGHDRQAAPTTHSGSQPLAPPVWSANRVRQTRSDHCRWQGTISVGIGLTSPLIFAPPKVHRCRSCHRGRTAAGHVARGVLSRAVSVGAGARSVRQESLRRAPIHPPTHSDSQPLTQRLTATHSGVASSARTTQRQRRRRQWREPRPPAASPRSGEHACAAPCQSSAGAAVVGKPPSRLPRREAREPVSTRSVDGHPVHAGGGDCLPEGRNVGGDAVSLCPDTRPPTGHVTSRYLDR